MKRWPLVLVAGLLLWAGVAPAQEALTIQLKSLAAGDRVQIERTETVKSTTLVVDPKGEKLRDATKTTVETSVFKETIVQRDGKKPPAKLERDYTKAQLTIDGISKALPYQGKTLVIEKQGDKYTFTIKDGAELPAADAQLLDREFNRHKDGKTEYKRLLMPKDAVKVNELWSLDMATALRPLQETGEMGFDAAKASGTGKLKKVTKKDDKTFGELHYAMKVPLTTLGKDKEKLDLLEGSHVNFDVTHDVCIDGSADIETRTIKENLLAKARLALPTGGTGDFTLTLAKEVREVRRELPK